MKATQLDDLRAVVFGAGLALLAYYGYAAAHVLAGIATLNRPVTWLGLVGSAVAIGVSMLMPRRTKA